ncbi:hypothetical protein AMTR_s00006p00253770 [Amborella trichopoda]|uniref:Uncharacterized protein n=1 Tax=Amborella trichopoda TaxID=13333 RepID=W1PFD7_AMBTC|nr:hypothetical protein AMTR_s00006p00253770 [Amborella trichopoda]
MPTTRGERRGQGGDALLGEPPPIGSEPEGSKRGGTCCTAAREEVGGGATMSDMWPRRNNEEAAKEEDWVGHAFGRWEAGEGMGDVWRRVEGGGGLQGSCKQPGGTRVQRLGCRELTRFVGRARGQRRSGGGHASKGVIKEGHLAWGEEEVAKFENEGLGSVEKPGGTQSSLPAR